MEDTPTQEETKAAEAEAKKAEAAKKAAEKKAKKETKATPTEKLLDGAVADLEGAIEKMVEAAKTEKSNILVTAITSARSAKDRIKDDLNERLK